MNLLALSPDQLLIWKSARPQDSDSQVMQIQQGKESKIFRQTLILYKRIMKIIKSLDSMRLRRRTPCLATGPNP
jgi:hypothetical protein